MSKVSQITKRFEVLFLKLKSFSPKEYDKVMANIETLKRTKFKVQHKEDTTKLREDKMTFKEFITQ